MHELSYILYSFNITFLVALTSLGVGIGGTKTAMATLQALNTQPTARPEISRVSIVAMALIETAGILAVVMALMLLQAPTQSDNFLYYSIAQCGIALSLGITGCVVGIYSAKPAINALHAIARQPFFSQKILNLMLLTQSIIQTPVIFGFLVALLIKTNSNAITSLTEGITLLAGGLCMGLGSIGPTIGLAQFAGMATKSIGINRNAYNKILPFTFISEAIIETPLVFALVVSLLLVTQEASSSPIAIIKAIAAALSIGLGSFSPSLSSARTATAACYQIALDPEHSTILSRVSMIGQALIDATAIYALLISLLILFL